jgi:hypothetical protein
MTLNKFLTQPILLDASVLLVGVEKNDDKFSFEAMKTLYIEELFNHFQDILIHETVFEELDDERKKFVSTYVGKNVKIVSENNLYGQDPLYTTIFNQIANFDLFKYDRSKKKDKGDVYSLAYASYHNIPFISTRDGSIIKAVEELASLNNVEVCGFEHLLLLGYLNNEDKELMKRYRSLYKSHCTPAINSGLIPKTFNEFVRSQTDN